MELLTLLDEVLGEIKKDSLKIKETESDKRFMDVSIPNLCDFAKYRVIDRRKKQAPARIKKIREELKKYKKELKLDSARLKELEEKGADALSEYDKTISSSNAKEGLKLALQLVRNHVAYDNNKIQELQTMKLELELEKPKEK